MKNSIKTIALAIIVAISTFSFTALLDGVKTIKTSESRVTWKGYKVTGSHEGIINLKSGELTFDNDKLVGGNFTVDMTTLISTDLSGEGKGKLEGHLKSAQFFGVANNPTSTLVFKTVKTKGKNSYNITGDLTIKGKTSSVNFDFSVYGSKATAALKIDRTVYGLTYGSSSFIDGLKDKAIYDEFDLVVDLVF